MFKAEGVIVAMVTPFKKGGELDEVGLRRLVDYAAEKRVDGVLAAGTVGEFHSMTREERARVFRVCVDQSNGRLPIYAGTGSVSTEEALAISKEAEDAGVDAITVLTPYFVRLTDEELYQHYRKIAGSVNLPVAIYSNPQRTGVTVSPECLRRCARLGNVAAIKDSSGDVSILQQYLKSAGKASVLVGRDGLILPALLLGAKGAVNAVGNVAPELVVRLYGAVREGDYSKARELQAKVSFLRQAMNVGSFPVAVKEAMNFLGLPGGYPRRPLLPLGEAQKKALKKSLAEAGLRPRRG
ncbi:MAG: 4-hydroxy-tetrahydrodipicolinate synthase [Candidatus Brockarchaeota archaeon]|nr:4-hydroxy-tetrahydrodipicolinate synthase [Candidatus Brockarchaeota archaeon]